MGVVVCGGMGRERNLLIGGRHHGMVPIACIQGGINEEDVRKMMPREWTRLQGFPSSFKLELADAHLCKRFSNSVFVLVIEAIAKRIKKVLDEAEQRGMGEPYVALKLIGDGRLHMADENSKMKSDEWMDVLELIKHEAADRIVTYVRDSDSSVIAASLFSRN